MLDARYASLRCGESGRAWPMWRPPGAIPSCCHTPGCGALRAPHPGICMVRPSGPNLADLAFYCREAAEALKARNIPAQGKHAESVRRPGCNGDYIRVPRPLWPQSAKLTGAKGAMELTCISGGDVGGMPSIRYQSLTDFRRPLRQRVS